MSDDAPAYRQPPLTFDFSMGNARRLLQASEQETDRQLMEHFGRLAESWISIAGLVNHRERGSE